MTLHELTALAAARLKDAGIAPEEAELDAQLLAARALGWDRTRLLTSWRDPSPAGFSAAYEPLVTRRERREPISQILGVREFWGLEFEVTRDVLTPRPETEGIIEAALEHAGEADVIEDIGTGSGCLAVALAKEFKGVDIVATDISAPAIAVARRNAVRHGVADRIAFVQTDGDDTSGDVDLIVSNPPYLPIDARDSLPPEVRDWEPPQALFAGVDGLDVIRHLVRLAAGGINVGSHVIFECGEGQASAIRDMIARHDSLDLVDIRLDLAGIPRVVVVRRTRV